MKGLQALAKKGPNDLFLDGLPMPADFPDWLTNEDLSYFANTFAKTGFRGSLNRYRAQQRDWEILPQLSKLTVDQPSYFVAGALDLVRGFIPGMDLFANPGEHCTDFRGKEIIKGKGHWIQQEASEQVNQAILAFLSGIAH